MPVFQNSEVETAGPCMLPRISQSVPAPPDLEIQPQTRAMTNLLPIPPSIRRLVDDTVRSMHLATAHCPRQPVAAIYYTLHCTFLLAQVPT